jgi:hypothetical protein
VLTSGISEKFLLNNLENLCFGNIEVKPYAQKPETEFCSVSGNDFSYFFSADF